MTLVHLIRCEPSKNMDRWYSVFVQPTLLDPWAVICTWGSRRTSYHRVRVLPRESFEEAMKIGAAIVAQKLRRGYLLAYKNEGALLAEDTIYIASCAAKNERYCQMERREEPKVRLRESALGGQVATTLQGHDLGPFQAVDKLS